MRRSTALLAAAATAVACTEGITTPSLTGSPMSLESSNVASTGAHEVARAFAMGLGDRRVREQLRDALRASPWTDHKVVLQEYITTNSGRVLLATAAAASGLQEDYLQALVAALPQADFYVPSRIQRRTWNPNAQIFIVPVFSQNTDNLTVYGPSGQAAPLGDVSEIDRRPILVIHGEEPKARRIAPQPLVPGKTIQDANDGEVGGRVVWYTGSDSTVVELADLSNVSVVAVTADDCIPPPGTFQCDTDPRDPSDPPPGPPDTSFVNQVETRNLSDCDGACGGNELVFEGWLYSGDTQLEGPVRFELSGMTAWDYRVVLGKILFAKPASGTRIKVKVHELDENCCNPDDQFYEQNADPYWTSTQNGLARVYKVVGSPDSEVAFNVIW